MVADLLPSGNILAVSDTIFFDVLLRGRENGGNVLLIRNSSYGGVNEQCFCTYAPHGRPYGK